MSHFVAFLYRIGYPVLRLYWFVCRPVTTGVKCLIVNDGRVLLVRHTYGSALRTTVGGGVKSKETTKEAVLREVAEEIGVQLDEVIYVGAVAHRAEYKRDTVHVFLAHTTQETFDLQTSEIREADWYPLDALPSDVSPLVERFVTLATPYMR